MKNELSRMSASFESIKHVENGAEYWSARELMSLLGYEDWRQFSKVVERAKLASARAGQPVDDQYIKSGNNYHLSRNACYLIVQNGDPRKRAVALAQSYIAMKTFQRERRLSDDKIDDEMFARLVGKVQAPSVTTKIRELAAEVTNMEA